MRTSTIDVRMAGIAGATRGKQRPMAWATFGLMTAVLALLAARADLSPGSLGPAATIADLTVGLAFVVGAILAPGPWRCRVWFAAVGLAWLLGSPAPAARLAYLAILVVALTLFPTGRPGGPRDWILVASTLLVVALYLAIRVIPPIPALAALMAAVAATSWIDRRWARATIWFPAVAAAGVALVLLTSWLTETTDPRDYDASTWLLGLELVLVAIAVGFPIASWTVTRERAVLADHLVGDESGAGIEGLAALLAETLGDPDLRILVWDPTAGRYRDSAGVDTEANDGKSLIIDVADGNGRLASVIHRGMSAMQDPTIVAAVIEAVRLTALHERWQAAQELQLANLEAARGRLLVATDRQRAATAARLRDEVVQVIKVAGAEIRRIDGDLSGAEARGPLDIAGRELEASADEILALISGLPPAILGNGGLVDAIAGLAARCPLPVSVGLAADARADVERETALFFVCSEAMANAIKHAHASHISIDLRRDRADLVIAISDDGVGGAQPSGFGLQGLADRLAAYGGRLRVESPYGVGTTLTARIPA